MEGLIPMVYKSIKKSNTRRKYASLSSGAAQNYEIADSYLYRYRNVEYLGSRGRLTPEPDKAPGFGRALHRRYNSVIVGRAGNFDLGEYGDDHVGEDDHRKPNNDDDMYNNSNKHVGKFRHHRMFSCISGSRD